MTHSKQISCRLIAKWMAMIALVLQVVQSGAGRCECRPAKFERIAPCRAAFCKCGWGSSAALPSRDVRLRGDWVYQERLGPAAPQRCPCPHDCCGRAGGAILAAREMTTDFQKMANEEPAVHSAPADGRPTSFAFSDSPTMLLSGASGAFRCVLLCRFTI